MVNTCCVPECMTNCKPKKDQKKSMFKIPSDKETRIIWHNSIPRKWESNYLEKQYYVCEDHFHENDIIKQLVYKSADVNHLVFPTKKPKLEVGAIPSIFKHLPSYLSKPAKIKRIDPEERLVERIKREKQEQESWVDGDSIKSFQDLCDNMSKKLNISNDYYIKYCNDYISIMHIKSNITEAPSVEFTITITNAFKIRFYKCHIEIRSKDTMLFNHTDNKWSYWSQLENSINYLLNYNIKPLDKLYNITTNLKFVDTYNDSDKQDDININFVQFISNQLSLSIIPKAALRYSADLLTISYHIYSKSVSCYKELINFFMMPSIVTLKRMSLNNDANAGLECSNYLELKKKFDRK